MSADPHFEYIFRHVFLPPQLPTEDDGSPAAERALFCTFAQALEAFTAAASTSDVPLWAQCAKAMKQSLSLRRDSEFLALRIKSQNAGLIIRKSLTGVSFESFELAATSHNVMTCKGRLIRLFPGPAILLENIQFDDHQFLTSLVEFLVKVDIQATNEAAPISRKGGNDFVEVRDTSHPKTITSFLTGILRSMGVPSKPQTIQKNTRDDVQWNSSYLPWRRSSEWLLLRVALQTTLQGSAASHALNREYKTFMIFYMARILQNALKRSTSSEQLYQINAKLIRRLLKLDPTEDTTGIAYVRETMSAANRVLVSRWASLQRAEKFTPKIPNLSFQSDTQLSLLKLGPYLEKIFARTSSLPESVPSPTEHWRLTYNAQTLPKTDMESAGDITRHLWLADVEFWVESCLPTWLTKNLTDSDTASQGLAKLIDIYMGRASQDYAGQPESFSVMVLTVLELWIALDSVALKEHSILKDYPLPASSNLLAPLLLPYKAQVQRLLMVEEYLRTRKGRANPQYPSLFAAPNKVNSLAVNFFNQSPPHGLLRAKIEAHAATHRANKQRDFEKLRQEYERLRQEADAIECEYIQITRANRRPRTVHSKQCQKCRLNSRKDAMAIFALEWPLPQGDSAVKAAVFELDVPTSIFEWRNATYDVLVRIFLPEERLINRETIWCLQDFSGLQETDLVTNRRGGSYVIASANKPISVSHFRKVNIATATLESVCPKSGMSYEAYDITKSVPVSKVLGDYDLRLRCTLQLPDGPYRTLQYSVHNTTHSPNQVVANQVDCPKSITLHEYLSFGTLRAGHRIQLENVARELISRCLKFGALETLILLQQAVWQVGPCNESTIFRESHLSLGEKSFGTMFVEALNLAVTDFEGNWQGGVAIRALAILACRFLSFSPHEQVRSHCADILRRCRDIQLGWVRKIKLELQDCQDETARSELNMRIVETAMGCHEAYSVGRADLGRVLSTNDDVAKITECAIAIHDHCPVLNIALSPSARSLQKRCWTLSHALEPLLMQHLLKDGSGLDETIGRLWDGFNTGTGWRLALASSRSWLVLETTPVAGHRAAILHYNVLDGTLLVDGVPLTRLPASYEAHPTYRRLFGRKVFDVIPSTMEGMKFESRVELQGCRVHFAMSDQELIIRSETHGRVHELVPISALEGDFPSPLIVDFTHWQDIRTQVMEWRPLQQTWKHCAHSWQMDPRQYGYCLTNGSQTLVDIRTSTAKMVASIFGPVEGPADSVITFDMQNNLLEVHLSTLNLDFFLGLNMTSFESRQFRGMKVDSDQSFGTMTGLINKLVLCAFSGPSRTVLIPSGHVEFKKLNDHVQVSVTRDSGKAATYHSFQIDAQLGRLTDNGSVESMLFKAYLHALTSAPLKDGLTGRTGTEQALECLSSACLNSFVTFSQSEIRLLKLVASLTPGRQYYPRHLTCMQEVTWKNLPSLSQHDGYMRNVLALLDRAQLFQVFQESPLKLPLIGDQWNELLVERAEIRNSVYFIHGFGAEKHSATGDVRYFSRQQTHEDASELRVCRIAQLVDTWSTDVKVNRNILRALEACKRRVASPTWEDPSTIGYDAKWLSSSSSFLAEEWCTIQKTMSSTDPAKHKYRIMFFLGALCFSAGADEDLARNLLAYATVPGLRKLKLPASIGYELEHGYEPKQDVLYNMVVEEKLGFNSCPESSIHQQQNETYSCAYLRHTEAWTDAYQRHATIWAQAVHDQWPNDPLRSPQVSGCSTYINVEAAYRRVSTRYQSWLNNKRFQEYARAAQLQIELLHVESTFRTPYTLCTEFAPIPERRLCITTADFVAKPAPLLQPSELGDLSRFVCADETTSTNHDSLDALITDLEQEKKANFQALYTKELRESYHAWKRKDEHKSRLSTINLHPLLQEHADACRDNVEATRQSLLEAFQVGDSVAEGLAFECDICPRTSCNSLLRMLSNPTRSSLPTDWKSALVRYGVLISNAQRATRLANYDSNDPLLLTELSNPGHGGWDPLTQPDWLLLELENDILIRPAQAQVALEMIDSNAHVNSVLQLNMGEGKTSVITPIVAATLADSNTLIRVLALKQLSRVMQRILISKLGGLLNRRIYYMPISRALQITTSQAVTIERLYHECTRSGGVLLAQPEHLLSFQLMGLESVISGKDELGKVMIGIQCFLDNHSRDILDESDEILSYRFELIYTIGTQRNVEFGPDRWITVQRLLDIVAKSLRRISIIFPRGLEYKERLPGSFPMVSVTDDTAADAVMSDVASHICADNGLDGLFLHRFSGPVKALLYKYITCPDFPAEDLKHLNETVFFDERYANIFLLLRGLVSCGVLRFAFKQKRWRVDYGLDPTRTVLAVPYRAKDQPAPRAEFSHPDSTIVLTCLSYYYRGLSSDELYTSFETLVACDNRDDQYALWTKPATDLHASFRSLNGVNLKDTAQCEQQLFLCLRYVKAVIDFYMNNHVFPIAMKEYPQKLSSSGWDIAKKKAKRTTGFSGTNDSRYLLPLSIAQQDLLPQLHTNAKVLHCLLHPENSFKRVTLAETGRDSVAEALLDAINAMTPPVRVIIDVGAQILEWQNREMASRWLTITLGSSVEAAVYFDESDDIVVLDRQGKTEPLFMSPFAKKLDQCVVYLDEVHTRGTDLQLPLDFRAAVTLSKDLPKDRLVQACMRMRKLDSGQHVVFVGFPDVQRAIAACCNKAEDEPIQVADVLRWCIAGSYLHIKRGLPLWATQGMRFQKDDAVWADLTLLDPASYSTLVAKQFLDAEAQTLDQRYQAMKRYDFSAMLSGHEIAVLKRPKETQLIRERCKEFGVETFQSCSLQEEQERELAPENEKEQQVERPRAIEPAIHELHQDVRNWVETGVMKLSSNAFLPAFALVRQTSAERHNEHGAWPNNLLMTRDFSRTVKSPATSSLDDFLRPVHWVAYDTRRLVVMSPWEVNAFLPTIRQRGMISLHIYAPRVTKAVRSLEDLSYCSIPACPSPWDPPADIMHLNLFAGQVYLASYEDYLRVCNFLGLLPPRSDAPDEVQLDGFVPKESRARVSKAMAKCCPFSQSPIACLRALTGMRRKGQSFDISHLGVILEGGTLKYDDF